MMSKETSYPLALEAYAACGVDTEQALATATQTPIAIHCWQGDDVGGFEVPDGEITGGGIMATGNYPGKPRSLDELWTDLEMAFSMLPGAKRIALQGNYADLGGRVVERSDYTIEHFQSWIDWCQAENCGFDLHPAFFSHPKAADNFTLAHTDPAIRDFWIAHGKACRAISQNAGKQLNQCSYNNFWVPDGYKDIPADCLGPRERLKESLDEIFSEEIDPRHSRDALESKLFGLGLESYTAGSHEFYLGYAALNQKAVCLDTGHFHPTESIADKISSMLLFVPEIYLHISRGVRWDSDHVTLFNDATRAILREVVCNGMLDRVSLGLDFFDGSINRVGALVIGGRAVGKSLLLALLEPSAKLRDAENNGDFTSRLAWHEAIKTLPFGAVWDEYCRRTEVPLETEWLPHLKQYETDVQSKR